MSTGRSDMRRMKRMMFMALAGMALLTGLAGCVPVGDGGYEGGPEWDGGVGYYGGYRRRDMDTAGIAITRRFMPRGVAAKATEDGRRWAPAREAEGAIRSAAMGGGHSGGFWSCGAWGSR